MRSGVNEELHNRANCDSGTGPETVDGDSWVLFAIFFSIPNKLTKHFNQEKRGSNFRKFLDKMRYLAILHLFTTKKISVKNQDFSVVNQILVFLKAYLWQLFNNKVDSNTPFVVKLTSE